MRECQGFSLEDKVLLEQICECALERAAIEHSFSEIMSQDQTVRAKLSTIIQTCALERGVRARPRAEP